MVSGGAVTLAFSPKILLPWARLANLPPPCRHLLRKWQISDFKSQISQSGGGNLPHPRPSGFSRVKRKWCHRADAPWAWRVCVHSVSPRGRTWRRIPADLRRFGRLRRPPQTATRLGLRSPSSPPSPPPSLHHRTPPITVQVFENAHVQSVPTTVRDNHSFGRASRPNGSDNPTIRCASA